SPSWCSVRCPQRTVAADALRTAHSTTSNVQQHPRAPAAVLFLDGEIVKRDRLHVGALMMPLRVQGLAGRRRCEKIFSFFFIDLRIADAQQKPLGILEINKLL